MFGFFKRNKPTIAALDVPTFGWEQIQDSKDVKQWIDPTQSQSLSLNFFALPPDLPTIKRVEELRQFFRPQIVAANGGIITVDIASLSGIPYVKTIFKFPQEPSGMTYLGSLIFPFKKYSYVVKIQAMETGTTGVRDTLIMNRMMAAGVLDVIKDGFKDWSRDPYEPDFEGGSLMNLSEAEAYDEEFEQHPLSQVRLVLRMAEEQLEVAEMLHTIAAFEK